MPIPIRRLAAARLIALIAFISLPGRVTPAQAAEAASLCILQVGLEVRRGLFDVTPTDLLQD